MDVTEEVKSIARLAIEQAIEVLFRTPGHQVVELRVPKAGKYRTISGYYSDFDKLADAIEEVGEDSEVESMYVTLNPVVPALLARAADRYKTYASLTTPDKDIARRTWLLVDIDPCRPAGISSTDAEKHLAGERIKAVRDYLVEQLSWPAPVLADSGNGYHLLFRIDLPNDDAANALVKGVLEALAARFDDDAVKVDTSVHNAARITKAYGSVARKGDSIPDRPHRMSRLLRVPDNQIAVPRELLEALAAEAPPATQQTNGAGAAPHSSGLVVSRFPTITSEQVEKFLEFYGIAHRGAESCSSGTKWVLTNGCIFNPDHGNKDAAVLLRTDGKLGYECFHASCQQNHWQAFRAELERRTGKKFSFGTGLANSNSKPATSATSTPAKPDTPEGRYVYLYRTVRDLYRTLPPEQRAAEIVKHANYLIEDFIGQAQAPIQEVDAFQAPTQEETA